MDEIGFRIIADAATPKIERGRTYSLQVAARYADVDRHSFHMKAVDGYA